MSTHENLLEDVKYLMTKITYLEGWELKSLCRDLGLSVMNMGAVDMIESLFKKLHADLDSYDKKPDRQSEKTLCAFRYNLLVKSKFLERYLDKIKKAMPD